MSVSRDQLLQFLSEVYEEQPDGQYNGLQVEGRKEIRTLVTGVSLCGDLIAEAVHRNADAILVHHGFFEIIPSSNRFDKEAVDSSPQT